MNTEEKLKFLKNIRMTSELTEKHIEILKNYFSEVEFNAEDVIFDNKEKDNKMYLIVSGEVKIIIPADIPIELLELKQGNHFGEFSLLDDGGRSACAIAQTDVKLLCMDKKSFDEICCKYPEIGCKIIRKIAENLCYFLRNGDKTVQAWFTEQMLNR